MRLYPLGYPVDVISEDTRVLEAATSSWGEFSQLFCGTAVRLTVESSAGGRPELAAPHYARDDEQISFTTEYGDSAVFNCRTAEACVRVHDAVISDGEFFRYHYLDAMTFTGLGSLYFTPIHAVCVTRRGRGVLLCGDSGAGKSSLAFWCAERGWTLTSDDAVYYAGGPRHVVVGRPWTVHLREPARGLFASTEDLPVITTPNGKRAIRLRAVEHCEVSPVALVAHCVFLDRGHGRAELTEFPVVNAAEYFAKTLGWADLEVHREQIAQLASRRLWRLRYEGLEDAASLLEELVRT